MHAGDARLCLMCTGVWPIFCWMTVNAACSSPFGNPTGLFGCNGRFILFMHGGAVQHFVR